MTEKLIQLELVRVNWQATAEPCRPCNVDVREAPANNETKLTFIHFISGTVMSYHRHSTFTLFLSKNMYKYYIYKSADPAFMRMAFSWRHGARAGKSCFGESTAKVQQNT